MTAASGTDSEAPGHEHRDVSGGWLRPAVFGAMDGLVTNVSLIAGVGGGGGAQHIIVLTGLAGLAAGAFSMATGEYVSVSSQNELVEAEVRKERHELEVHPDAEREELAAMLQHRGIDPELASQVAKQISTSPEEALGMHVREELGVDHVQEIVGREPIRRRDDVGLAPAEELLAGVDGQRLVGEGRAQAAHRD